MSNESEEPPAASFQLVYNPKSGGHFEVWMRVSGTTSVLTSRESLEDTLTRAAELIDKPIAIPMMVLK